MRLPAQQRNARICRERDLRALSRLTLLLFCGLVLSGGFVFAAQQHFAAVKFGYTSEELRVERDRLLRERQQLLLQKEQASSPGRLESAAKALGLRPVSSTQIGTKSTAEVARRIETKKKQR